MKSGETGYLKIKINGLDSEAMSLVEDIVFSIKTSSALIQKRYPGVVTFTEGAFLVPLTQEDTTALVGHYVAEAQINFADRSVSKSDIECGKISQTVYTEFIEGNYPNDEEVAAFELDITPVQIVSGGGVSSYNQLTNKPKINGTTLSGDKSFSDLGLDEYIEAHHEELKGDKGDPGKDGSNGLDGSDGASAYDIAVAHGYPGTETEWLASLKGETGPEGQPGQNGQNGQPGRDGSDGFSPSASVERTSDGAVITITDKSGTTSATVYDGQGGGADVPIATTSVAGKVKPDGSTITVDADGTIHAVGGGGGGTSDYNALSNKPKVNGVTLSGNKDFRDLGLDTYIQEHHEELKGDKGDAGYTPIKNVDYFDGAKGDDGFSPSASVERVSDGAVITITDKLGTTTAKVNDGQGGGGSSGVIADGFIAEYNTELTPVSADNYSINSDGSERSNANYTRRRYNISPEYMYYLGFIPKGYTGYAFYDSNGNRLSYKAYTTTMNNEDGLLQVVSPPNASVLYLYYKTSDGEIDNFVYAFTGYKVIGKDNPLNGKKWYAVGDSFTEGSYMDYVDADGKTMKESDAYNRKVHAWVTYPSIVGERNGMKWINAAKGGSLLVKTSTSSLVSFSDLTNGTFNYTLIPEDTDYITIAFGLNEQSRVSVGTKTDTTNTTTWGAYNLMFEYLLTHYPLARIGVIISDGWMQDVYRKAIVDICEYWAIPYLDLAATNLPHMIVRNNPGVAMNDADKYSTTAQSIRNATFAISDTNYHPNPIAHRYRADMVENWLKGLATQRRGDASKPEKGVDYWTEADKAEIVADVIAALPNAEGSAF